MQAQLNKLKQTIGGHQVRSLKIERHPNGIYFIHGDLKPTGQKRWVRDIIWAKDGTCMGLTSDFNLQVH